MVTSIMTFRCINKMETYFRVNWLFILVHFLRTTITLDIIVKSDRSVFRRYAECSKVNSIVVRAIIICGR